MGNSMYIQLTTRCNMRCKHCGFACTAKGEDMPMEVFKKTIEWAAEYDDTISLGGGEPTIHPQFMEMLGLSILYANEHIPWLATNGKETKIALKLAQLAKCGIISCELSQDPFHEKIDPKVVEAFKKYRPYDNYTENKKDYRGVRNTSHNLIKAGRCKKGDDYCICEEIFIKPNGDIHQCGCKNSTKIGNVLTDIPSQIEMEVCYKNVERE